MSREGELGLFGQAKLFRAHNFPEPPSRSCAAIRIKGAEPDEREILVAQLVAARADQRRLWPEIVRVLELAESKDWSRPVLVVPETGEPKGMTVRRFGSFEALYAELVEPWLRPYAELHKTYARLKAGEIVEQEGAAKIKLRAGPGRPRKSETENLIHGSDYVSAEKLPRRERTIRRLRRDDPGLAARVERGEITANAAAVQLGWRKPLDPYRQLCRWWDRAPAEDRARFLARLCEAPEVVATFKRAAARD